MSDTFVRGAESGKRDWSMLACFLSMLLFLLFCVCVLLALKSCNLKSEVEELEHVDTQYSDHLVGSKLNHTAKQPTVNNVTETSVSTQTVSSESTITDTTMTNTPQTVEKNEAEDFVGEVEIAPEGDQGLKKIESTACQTPVLQPPCDTQSCQKAVYMMLSLLDNEVDPCRDFYSYSCSKTSNKFKLVDRQELIYTRILNTVDLNLEKPEIKIWNRIYNSCMTFDEVPLSKKQAEAKLILNTLEGFDEEEFPMSWPKLTNLVSQLILLNRFPFFEVSVKPGANEKFIFQVVPPMKEIPWSTMDNSLEENCSLKYRKNRSQIYLNNIYVDYESCLGNQVYKQNLRTSFSFFGYANNTRFLNFVERHHTTLKEISQNLRPKLQEMKTDFSKPPYSVLTVKQMNETYSKIDWVYLLQRLTNKTVPFDSTVHLYFTEYFDRMFQEMAQFQERQLYNALHAAFIHDLYVNFFSSKKSAADRSTECVALTSKLLPDITSQIYFNSFTKHEVVKYTSLVQSTFEQLQNTEDKLLHFSGDWMTSYTKVGLRNKLKNIKVIPDGGFSVFGNNTFLTDRISSVVNMSGSGSFMSNFISLTQRNQRLMYESWDEKAKNDKQYWTIFSTTFNDKATVIRELNTVIIPYSVFEGMDGILTLPSFFVLPQLGFTIAAEIAKHFDYEAIRDSSDGKLLIDQVTKGGYDETLKCLQATSETFARSHVLNSGQSVSYLIDMQNYIDTRFTDDAALHMLYELAITLDDNEQALKWLNLTREQAVYIAAAQSLCTSNEFTHYTTSMFKDLELPPMLRVPKFIQNSNMFGSVFQCKKGEDMTPGLQCGVFPSTAKFIEDLDY